MSIETKIKICGLKRIQDIEAVNGARPDYAGFILEFPKSHRNISMKQLYELRNHLNDGIMAVGVFVDQPEETILQYTDADLISVVQLHGNETEEFVRRIKEKTCKPVIKAFSVRNDKDIERALRSPADLILLDQGAGGTGAAFDWSILPKIARPWFLAGGLCQENIQRAVTEIQPWGIDLSSGVETDRIKDKKKINNIIQTVRNL